VERFAAHKRILSLPVRYSLKEGSKSHYEQVWQDYMQHVRSVCEWASKSGGGTLVVDSETEQYALARLAHFGKLSQVPPNRYDVCYTDLREIIRLVYETPKLNAVFIQKMGIRFNSNPPEWEVRGFSDIPYLVQANIRVSRDDIRDKDGHVTHQFHARVLDCRQNIAVAGVDLTGPMCSIEMLLGFVHGQ